MTTTRKHHPVRRGELWSIQPDEIEGRPAYWLTFEAADRYCRWVNRAAELTREIQMRLPSQIGARVTREEMGGGRIAWAIDFDRYDTVDGPRLILTDDTDEHYQLGIYDTRQEVPGGPEPILETTHLRVEEKRDETGVHPAARIEHVAEYVADRARFVYALATTDALEIEASWEKEDERRA